MKPSSTFWSVFLSCRMIPWLFSIWCLIACLVLLPNCLHIWISFSPCEVISQILPQQSTGEAVQLLSYICSIEVIMHFCETFVFHKIQEVHKSPYSHPNIFNKAESKYMMIALQFFRTNINCFSFIFMGTIIFYSWENCSGNLFYLYNSLKKTYTKNAFEQQNLSHFMHVMDRRQPDLHLTSHIKQPQKSWLSIV